MGRLLGYRLKKLPTQMHSRLKHPGVSTRFSTHWNCTTIQGRLFAVEAGAHSVLENRERERRRVEGRHALIFAHPRFTHWRKA